MKKYFNTEFDIGDSVWTVELGVKIEKYYVTKRYVEYFKLVTDNVFYGFTYNIEIPRAQCFHTEAMAEMCAERWNKKLEELKEKYKLENKEYEGRMISNA